jgi:hypothetical protein
MVQLTVAQHDSGGARIPRSELSRMAPSHQRFDLVAECSQQIYLTSSLGAQTQLFGWLVYTVLLWTLKFCWLFFYLRLGEGVSRMKLKIYFGFIFCIVTFLGTFGAILLKCQPIKTNWQIYPDPGNTCQPAVSKFQAYVLISTNLATDLYIMSIPLPVRSTTSGSEPGPPC